MSTSDLNIDHLREWVGRSETVDDTASAGRAALIAAVLDHDTAPEEDAAFPAPWHWCLFNPVVRGSLLGPDGHPFLGGFMPPIPLPRRMWVGGRLEFPRALLVGEHLQRRTTISDITAKSGRSGDLIFVTLTSEVSDRHGVGIREQQDLVYREASLRAPAAASPSVGAAEAQRFADWRHHLQPDPVMLFRYSALTMNAHRIHYDAAYGTGVEGYPALVVHGPLTATLLLDSLAREVPGRLTAFSFRAVQPLFSGEVLALCGRHLGAGEFELWAENSSGAVAMTAQAQLAE